MGRILSRVGLAAAALAAMLTMTGCLTAEGLAYLFVFGPEYYEAAKEKCRQTPEEYRKYDPTCVWLGFANAPKGRADAARAASERRDPDASAAGGKGQPFTATLRFDQVVDEGEVKRKGKKKLAWKGMVALGSFDGRLTGSGSSSGSPQAHAAAVAVEQFLDGSARLKLDATQKRKTRKKIKGAKVKVRGLALATHSDGVSVTGQTCTRLRMKNKFGRKPRGSLSVLGGSGEASTLHAEGTFRVKPMPDDTARLNGTIQASEGEARAIPAACKRF